MIALIVFVSTLNTASALAVPKTTCQFAQQFFNSSSYACNTRGEDCSRGECVELAVCRYIGGYEGYTFTFSYPPDCDIQKN